VFLIFTGLLTQTVLGMLNEGICANEEDAANKKTTIVSNRLKYVCATQFS